MSHGAITREELTAAEAFATEDVARYGDAAPLCSRALAEGIEG